MKKRFGLGLVIMFTLTLMPLTFISAEEMTTTNTSDQTTQTTATEDKFEIDDAKAADYQKRLEERLEKRRNALKEKVTAAQQVRIKARCEAAQTKIAEVAKKAGEAKSSRQEIYSNILTKLNNLQTKLAGKGHDTTKLKASIAELQALVDTFNTDLQSMRQAATDVSAMDCKDSPVGFKASLDELRTARDQLAKDSEAVRAYIKDNLKPALQEIRTSVDEMKKENTQNGEAAN